MRLVLLLCLVLSLPGWSFNITLPVECKVVAGQPGQSSQSLGTFPAGTHELTGIDDDEHVTIYADHWTLFTHTAGSARLRSMEELTFATGPNYYTLTVLFLFVFLPVGARLTRPKR